MKNLFYISSAFRRKAWPASPVDAMSEWSIGKLAFQHLSQLFI